MAQQTTDALDALTEDGVTTVNTPSGAVAYVAPEATTGGPAMDPVEVWADHQDQYAVEYEGRSSDGTDVYTLTEVQG